MSRLCIANTDLYAMVVSTSETAYVVITTVLLTLVAVDITGNTLVFLIVKKYRQMRYAAIRLFASLF